MAFKVFGSYNSYTSAAAGAGSGDKLLNITVAASGNTGESLPANALIKQIVLKGTVNATISFGSAVDAELLVPSIDIVADTRESFAPAISLPALFPVYAYGIAGVVSITFVYQIVTL